MLFALMGRMLRTISLALIGFRKRQSGMRFNKYLRKSSGEGWVGMLLAKSSPIAQKNLLKRPA